VYFRCEHCGSVVRGQDDQAGQMVPCQACRHEGLCPSRPASVTSSSSGRRWPSAGLASIGALALLSIGWAFWNTTRAIDDVSSSATGPLSPVEARQRAILQDAAARPGDPALGRLFQELNTKHFATRLPAIPVTWDPALADVGALAAQAFTLEGMFGVVGGQPMILLHPHLSDDPAGLARALSHEMVHAYLHVLGEDSTTHGARFQTELKRLSTEGAFTGIVADDAERETLKAWIDTEGARLATDADIQRREAVDLERERLELEGAVTAINARVSAGGVPPDRAAVDALKARHGAYNRRAREANARAERHRSDVVALNHQIERYNLMLVYPDGIEHELVRAQAEPPSGR
jgi:hypothetical protein